MINMKQYSKAKLYSQLQMYALPTLEHTNMACWNDDYPIPDVTSHLLAGYKETCTLITSET